MTIQIKDIQRDLMFQVIWNMRRSSLTLQKAKQLAKEVVGILKGSDTEGVIVQLCILGKTYKEARPVCIKYGRLLDEKKRTERIPSALRQISEGALEQALAILKGGIIYG